MPGFRVAAAYSKGHLPGHLPGSAEPEYFRVGLGPSGHQSISETFFIFLRSSNLFLNVFTEPAEITSSLRLFHLFTILREKKYFLTSNLKLSFASFRECPLVLSLLSARKNEFHAWNGGFSLRYLEHFRLDPNGFFFPRGTSTSASPVSFHDPNPPTPAPSL